MGRIVVIENVTLDGVMQAPGGADEDPRNGFRHGGWAQPYTDRVMAEKMAGGMRADGALLFGRRTYEQFHGFWPGRTDGNPYTEVLNRKRKYVVSRTLAEPLPWANSTLVDGDLSVLKKETDGDLAVLGSGVLVRSLLAAGLVDVFTLSIHPLTLGSGTKLFDPAWYGRLELIEAVPTTTGVIIASYRPVTGGQS